MQCPACEYQNAASSRFCRQCGAALPAPSIATLAASAQDHADAALQEQLVTQPVNNDTDPPVPDASSDAALAPGAMIGAYTIVEPREGDSDTRTWLARAAADVCQQCGTPADRPDARFCEECGAELLPRDVLLLAQTGESPNVLDRVMQLPDEPIKALLPPVSVVDHDGQRFYVVEATVPGWQSLAELLASQGDAPDQPAALDESDALPLALQLAQAIQFLHAHDLALGHLSLAQLLVGPQGTARIRDLTALQPLDDTSRSHDLASLHRTLEELTRTPRATRKLDPATVEGETVDAKSLSDVLIQARIGALPDADAWVAALSSAYESQRALVGLPTRVGALSNVGMVRELNEDSLLSLDWKLDSAGRPVNAGLYVVADGMGGHEGGEVASALAVQSMAHVVSSALIELAVDSAVGLDDARLSDLALQAAERANAAVFEEARRRGNDMGTTLTFALVVGDRAVIGNVGDSRTYLLRDGQLQRISKDHSLVQRLVDMGQIGPDDVYTHPHRNAIMRSLGERPQVQTDLFPLRLQPGDAILCCSDGQWEMVRDPRMQEIITATDDPQTAVETLIAEGNQNGGEDNITAILIRFGA